MVTENNDVAFPIVGIGASAGGLEALDSFFRVVPWDIGMAFVIVQHLDPTHDSLLSEILQRTTRMPVVEVSDQQQTKPNCVYVIPPNRDMAILHGKLILSVPHEPHGQRLPIDAFLRSLAEDRQEKAIGIILSGTGTDGTQGLRAILGAGGVTLVQEPSNAKYDGMPASAIKAGYASQVLPVDKMPEALQLGIRQFAVQKQIHNNPKEVNGISRVLLQLRTLTGHDFSQYKKSTIVRRIERRMSQNAIEDADIYARFLKEHPSEGHALFKELLINVTNFFRDTDAFVTLQNEILPALCKDKSEHSLFRAWVAGCATGEEAYSIAILLKELMEEHHYEFKVQIYSTDLDDEAIAIARAGVYPPNIAQDVSPERLRRFFTKEDAGYRIKKEIREMVVFAIQNVIKDPPFTKLDLLSCRNLMIYLGPELQNRLIPTFHYALKPNGVLFLSTSESIGNFTELFSSINRKWKFYRAIHSIVSSRTVMTNVLSWTTEKDLKTPEEIKVKPKETNFADLTRRVMMQCYAPASVITDLKGNILYVHGETGKYLRPAPGQSAFNVIEMAREGLELELRNAIRTAANDGASTLNREIQVKMDSGVTSVSFSVRPLASYDSSQNFLMVSFQEIANPPLPSAKSRQRVAKPKELGRIEELERDLAYLKENYQATLEEQQASNEELKSTNEEMQSTNEELQSTNEELETSKEELQSVNEELITVNSELQAKIDQLAGMQNDMKNLLDNTHIGTVFLDEKMKIRRFTREATVIYRLVATDIGRPLSDIKSNFEGEALLLRAKSVLETLIPFEQEIQIHDGIWHLARIQPYRTLENVIEGIVLTFTDISKRVEAENAVRLARDLAESVVDTIDEPLLVMDGDFKVISANRSFYRFFQVAVADTVGRKIYELGNNQWNIPALRELLEIILPRDQAVKDFLVEHDFPIIGHQKIQLNARRIIGKSSELSLILLTTKEVGGRINQKEKNL
ncbi:MAG: PAS domain-containing protein [Methylococcaceae bacterium]|nr:PAS domain-containing protein [Methylococcaceae bacterium]